MVNNDGKLDRHTEETLIAEMAVQTVRLELEKLHQHIADILRLGDEGLIDGLRVLDDILKEVKKWIRVWQFYNKHDRTQIAFPLPDHEDDKVPGRDDEPNKRPGTVI